MADDIAVAESTRLLRHPQISRIDELDEFGRLMVEPGGRVRRIGRSFPELFVLRQHMGLFFVQAARRASAVAIGATEHDVLFGFMHWFDPLMALQTADAFGVCLLRGLINPVSRR